MDTSIKNQSIDTRERVRKSFDKIRVNNPFDKDYSTVWDGFHHIVRAHSYAILDRFLAEKWLEEQCKRLITEKADSAVKAENQRRIKNGMAIMDKTRKTGEQYEFETPFYANWTAQFATVIKEFGLYGGIEQEYGMEYVPQQNVKSRDLNLSLIDELEVTPVAPKVAHVESGALIDNLENKDVFTLRKMAKEKGIETNKTDKKADLIRAISA
jgi:hypothetical protein